MTYREAEVETGLKGWDWEGRITDAIRAVAHFRSIFNHKKREMLAVRGYDTDATALRVQSKWMRRTLTTVSTW